MSAAPEKPPEKAKTPDEISVEFERPSQAEQRQIELEAAILDELRRMNRLLYNITYGPRRYTLAFFSGIVRGLGALLGATVVFALLVGLLSRLDTVPLIGSYVSEILEFVQQNVGLPSHKPNGEPKPQPTAVDTPKPEPSPTP